MSFFQKLCPAPFPPVTVGMIPWRRGRLPTPVFLGFSSGSRGNESACSTGDLGLIPGYERFPRGGYSNPPQYSCHLFLISSASVQFSSIAQLCPTLCDPMNHSTPGLPVHHQLPKFTQTHIHRISDAIQPSHPLSSPSPPAPNPSQHQSLFQ